MIHKGDILPVQSSPGSKANLLANFSVLHHNIAHGSKKDLASAKRRQSNYSLFFRQKNRYDKLVVQCDDDTEF